MAYLEVVEERRLECGVGLGTCIYQLTGSPADTLDGSDDGCNLDEVGTRAHN